MEIFEEMGKNEHEQLVFWCDKSAGYRGLIAIHDTTLGPALGGTRFWNYASDSEAVTDVLRLSRGMTYKARCSACCASWRSPACSRSSK